MIEDFFSKSVLNQKLNGKSFNPGSVAKPFNAAKEFGKYLFAEKIVRPQQATINFSKFKPLLARVVMAIDDYASKV